MASVIVCSSRLLRVRSPEIQHTPITKTTARTMLPTGRQNTIQIIRIQGNFLACPVGKLLVIHDQQGGIDGDILAVLRSIILFI